MADTKGDPPRKILIIGAGIAGLTLALSLRRMAAATGLNIKPVIYESSTVETYGGGSENGPHWLMWRYAVETLLELGLGKRLGKIAWPILNFKSTDAETNEVLVQWPPEDPAAAAAADPELAAGKRLGNSYLSILRYVLTIFRPQQHPTPPFLQWLVSAKSISNASSSSLSPAFGMN